MKTESTILVVDDDEDQQFIYKKYFEKTPYNLITVGNGNAGLKFLQQNKIDLIILDYMMPGMNGYEFMSTLASHPIKQNVKSIPVIMLSSLHKDRIPQDELRQLGVDLFLAKPFSFPVLLEIIENLIPLHSRNYHRNLEDRSRIDGLEQENCRLKLQLNTKDFSNIIAISSKMRQMLEKIENYASAKSHIFLVGAPGTEKAKIARMLHFSSDRSEFPFIPFHVANLPSSLLEYTLFGCEENTLPALKQSSEGLLKKAEPGTLFLSDFDKYDTRTQNKIIRFLLTKSYQKIHSLKYSSCDTRVIIGIDCNKAGIIAKNNLKGAFEEKKIHKIHIPPLNERQDDIAPLIHYFTNKYKKQKKLKFSKDALKILERYNWPGNVKELEILIRSLAESHQKSTILPDDLPQNIRDFRIAKKQALYNHLPLKEARKKWVSQFETEYLHALLARCDGNISKVAKYARVNRMTIYRLLSMYNISHK